MSRQSPTAPEEDERALLVQVILPGTTREAANESLDELARLADTAGVTVLDRVVQRRRAPDSAYYIGGAGTPWLLSAADIADWQGLCAKLSAHEEGRPSQRVWELLAPEQRRRVERTAGGAKLQDDDRAGLVKALNSIVNDRDFHRDRDFAHVDVPEKAHALLSHKSNSLSDKQVQTLNRLLLEAAFPDEIAKRRGKVQEVKQRADQLGANLVIFDNDLSATNIHNWDHLLRNQHVIDRTQLVLQIFARRARSAEAELQVELAQLEYTMPRLPERHAGKREWGGTGMRGPGETRIQRRATTIRTRIRALRRKLKHLDDRRAVERRRRHQLPCVTLVGYTNAGKSTLMNALAHEHVYADDKLFATLDTTSRRLHLRGRDEIILSDSVGFIRNMPTHLIASFRSTLAEARDADVLIHVADASHRYLNDQVRVVEETLTELGCADAPTLLVLNKIDLVDDERRAELCEEHPRAIPASALRKRGLSRLVEELTGEVATVSAQSSAAAIVRR